MITKDNCAFIHVEYKSNDGNKFPLMFAQAKKYIYNYSNLKFDSELFGIYAKGEMASFFIINDHGHSDNGYLLKGPMYNGMFGLYVDLQERIIRIMPQENTYTPQYVAYNMSDKEGYLRAEIIMKFMSICDSVPEVVFNNNSNRFEFRAEGYKKFPVQVFFDKNKFNITFVDTKGKISFRENLDLKTALEFANRPSFILNNEFIADQFKRK